MEIPGHDRECVYRPEEILRGQANPSGRIVVLDAEGLHTGVGLAEILALRGAEVEFMTPYFMPMSARLTETQDAYFIIRRLYAAGVKFTPTTYIKNIGDGEVTVYNVHNEHERVIKGVDAVVLSTARIPVNDLEKELDGTVTQLFTIGDALAPRVWSTASFEGQKFARLIGEPNAPRTLADVYFGPDPFKVDLLPADVTV
jgi:hypothetical protein